ncbi:MAG: glycosyltransferase family 39 protein [Anaerolineae bacterium]|nr:glycosyltransferase family 39 protein [Anaerolineae bacterium]
MSERINPKSKIQNLVASDAPEGAKSKIRPLLWLLILSLAFAWRAQNLDAFGLSNDEGAHVMWAKLAVDGYPLYSQTYAVQSPLFLETVALAFRLAGPTLQVGRWAILPSFGLLALALSWLAYRSGGWAAALTALLLISLSPLSFTFSRLVMAEVPATALAVVSVALMFGYLEQKRKIWLVASGLALGLSFIVKPLNPFVAAPIGLLLVISNQKSVMGGQWSVVSGRLLWWSLGLIIPLAAVLLLYDPAALYDQLVRFRNDLRAAIPGSTVETWDQFKLFFNSHWGFWLLAFGGIMAAVWRVWLEKEQGSRGAGEQGREFSPHRLIASSLLYPFIWLVWLIAGIVMLYWHTPLFPHHFIVLLPPLILLGAELVSQGLGFRVQGSEDSGLRPALSLSNGSPVSGHWPPIVGVIFIIIAAFNLPAMIAANQSTAAIVTGGREAEALKLLRAVSAPADFVMGDSQLLIFMADRRTPPPLGDVALVAIKAGRQTSERMIQLTEQFQAPVVVQWSLRLPWLPEYLAWVQANYLAQRVWDNDHIIYFGRRLAPDETIPNERQVRLGDSVMLRGYQIEDKAKAGSTLNLKVYWQTDTALTEDYTIFTQLLNSQGALAASWDSQPLSGYFPTSQWPAGEIVTDMVQLPLPADLSPGDYTLITGMYRLETLERLRASDGSDFVTLTTVRIE